MVGKSLSASFTRRNILVVLAVAYAVAAVLCAGKVIVHTEASTHAIEQILTTYNIKNEGEQALERYSKEHPFLSFFMASPVKHELKLPSPEAADEALSDDVMRLLKQVRQEAFVAAWWSWDLLNLSLLYIVTVVALARRFRTRAVLFALTCASLTFFVIGIFAPAMVVWTAPTIPMASGNLQFVLQHQVRGIAAIIRELITSGHWVVGGFLLLFSIVTPLTKAALTFFVTACRSPSLNQKIGQFLHAIGKWSMADVFVAGVILSLYALKAQEATKSVPCLGLYYFMGYCVLSMTTTELLVQSGVVAGGEEKKEAPKLGAARLAVLVAVLVGFVTASSLYTYQQYTLNMKQKVTAATPGQLNNANLVLPVHK